MSRRHLVYSELCDGDTSGVTDNPSIAAFYAELTSKHPEIDDIPEEQIDNTDLCPWSIAFDKSSGHLLVCCVWEKADYVYELLAGLSVKHNLAIYSPQAEIISYPDGSDGGNKKVWWKLW